MRRLLPFVVVLALTGAACSGSDEPAAAPSGATVPTSMATTPSPTTATSSPSESPIPTVDPDVRLPEGVPPVVDDAVNLASISSGDLAPLAPPGAGYENRSTLEDPFEQRVLTWSDGAPPDGRTGLIVWQRSEDGTWRAVYAFTDPARRGVFGIRVDTGDLTGDAIPDILSFEDVGGSGACGTYRVVSTSVGDASEIFRREACDTQIAISAGDLRIREAIFRADDPHCCPSAFRESTLRWNGTSWDEISSEVTRNDPA